MLSNQQTETFIYSFRQQIEALQIKQASLNGNIAILQKQLVSLSSTDNSNQNSNVAVATDSYIVGVNVLHKLKHYFQQAVSFAADVTIGGILTLSNTLGVPSGGTGRTSLAAHGVLLGNGVSGINVAAPSTSGYVLTDNGAGADPSFQPIASGGVSNQLDVTAGRALGTDYQNTTGKPLYVGVWADAALGSTMDAFSDNVATPITKVASTYIDVTSEWQYLFFIVLTGNYYRVDLTSGNLDGWVETW